MARHSRFQSVSSCSTPVGDVATILSPAMPRIVPSPPPHTTRIQEAASRMHTGARSSLIFHLSDEAVKPVVCLINRLPASRCCPQAEQHVDRCDRPSRRNIGSIEQLILRYHFAHRLQIGDARNSNSAWNERARTPQARSEPHGLEDAPDCGSSTAFARGTGSRHIGHRPHQIRRDLRVNIQSDFLPLAGRGQFGKLASVCLPHPTWRTLPRRKSTPLCGPFEQRRQIARFKAHSCYCLRLDPYISTQSARVARRSTAPRQSDAQPDTYWRGRGRPRSFQGSSSSAFWYQLRRRLRVPRQRNDRSHRQGISGVLRERRNSLLHHHGHGFAQFTNRRPLPTVR